LDCLPDAYIESEEDALTYDLNDRLEPILKQSSTDIELPKLALLRSEKELPNSRRPTTEHLETLPQWRYPCTEQELPSLLNALRLRLEPRCKTSITEQLPPILPGERTLKLLPKEVNESTDAEDAVCTLERMERDDPNSTQLNNDTILPVFTMDRILRDEPRTADDKTDMVAPNCPRVATEQAEPILNQLLTLTEDPK
jgi:hypothetical protein